MSVFPLKFYKSNGIMPCQHLLCGRHQQIHFYIGSLSFYPTHADTAVHLICWRRGMSEIEILEFQSFICLQTSWTNCNSSIVFVIWAFYMIVKGIVHPPSIYSIMYMTCVMYSKSSKIIQYNSVEETDQNVSLIM